MKEKQKILVFIDWYVPAYKAGGPIRSVYTLVENLHKTYDFYIITSNADIDGEVLANIKENRWTRQGNANVLYLPNKEQTIKRIKQEYNKIKPNKVYLNSLFSTKFTLMPLLAFRQKSSCVVVAPRGMLGQESLAIKPLKKKLFLSVAKMFGLYKNVYWHATSLQEQKEIKQVFGHKTNIKIAKNLALIPASFNPIKKEKNKLKILMVGRIVPIKNIHFLLETLKHIDTTYSIELTLVGPLEDTEYWDRCKNIIKDFPPHITVKNTGAIPPIEVSKLFLSHHLLVSTSLNENYGHSIAEALSYGRPVVVSNYTPWKNLEKLGIGANLDLEESLFRDKIMFFAGLDNEAFEIYQKKARNYAEKELQNQDDVIKAINVFL